MLKLTTYPYRLQFKFPFRISHGVREYTEVVFVKLEQEGRTAWGEAALPPYLPETTASVIHFLDTFSKSQAANTVEDWLAALHLEQTNTSARAALDMALWSLKAQISGHTEAALVGVTKGAHPMGTYTLGVSSAQEMKQKVAEAKRYGFSIFKLKLNGKEEEEMVTGFRQLTDRAFAVDVNQGWRQAEEAKRKIEWLSKRGCMLVEQPLPVAMNKEMKGLKQSSALPLYADESCRHLADIAELEDGFDGLNIKLMKCGGLHEAVEMITKARTLRMKILIGCMSESSVGCRAAAWLTPLADYADLDGPYLISNDPFEGIRLVEGRVQPTALRQIRPIL